jgi:uncharacterized membrane protein
LGFVFLKRAPGRAIIGSVSSPIAFSTLALLGLWIAATVAWGRAFLPLSRRVFPSLPDGGLAAGRLLFWTLACLAAFELASLRIVSLQFAPILILALPLALQAWLRREPARREEFLSWARARKRDLLISDAIFVAAWLFFAWVRLRNPAASDAEKPMDMGLLASAARASWLPFETFWFSGSPFTNYYYFGPLMGALAARALATPPHLAYNLVQPLFCALFVSILAALCADLCRSRNAASTSRAAWARGLWAMAIVALLGHFEPLRQRAETGSLAPSALDSWKTSRVIPNTINEYPLFTLGLGDAHAHFYALALAALLFSLAWSLFCHAPAAAPSPASDEAAPLSKSQQRKLRRQKAAQETVQVLGGEENPPAEPPHGNDGMRPWRLAAIGLLLGVFVISNTWDAPLYTLLALSCAVLTQPRSARSASGWARSLAPFALAPLVALPYLFRFRSQVQGVTFEKWLPEAGDWLLLWSGIVGLALLGIAGALRADSDRRRFWAALSFCGAVALVAPSIFYIKGFFGDGDFRHQDTVFKFGLQAWLLLGIAGACATWWLLDRLPLWPRRAAFAAWATVWIVPLACSLSVIHGRAGNAPDVLSLDASKHLPPEDQRAVAWLWANARRGDVVLEAVRPEGGFYSYSEYGRVASLTGVPTPLGWTQHAWYWGADLGREIEPRHQMIKQIWAVPDSDDARNALRKLQVTHIFVGALERAQLSHAAISEVGRLGREVFRDGETFIIAMPAAG